MPSDGRDDTGTDTLSRVFSQFSGHTATSPSCETGVWRGLLAVIAAGSPIVDVIARLTQVQAENPGAQVRRGKKDSWEIWTAPAEGRSS